MENQSASRNALVVFAFTAIVIGAWAMAESWSDATRVPDFSPRAETPAAASPIQPVTMPEAPAAPAERAVAPIVPPAPPVQPVAVKETLSANETVVAPAPSRIAPAKRKAASPRKATPLRKTAAPRKATSPRKAVAQRKAAPPRMKVHAPLAERSARIVVQERRPPSDARVRAEVIDAIAATPNISGRIGVESHDAAVRLSGYTATASQASRAGRAAATVRGVRSVRNDIRPRVGGPE